MGIDAEFNKLRRRIKRLESQVRKLSIIAGTVKADAKGTRLEVCMIWLDKMMTYYKGEVFTSLIVEDAEKAGYNEQLLGKAKRALGLESISKGSDGWVWISPKRKEKSR